MIDPTRGAPPTPKKGLEFAENIEDIDYSNSLRNLDPDGENSVLACTIRLIRRLLRESGQNDEITCVPPPNMVAFCLKAISQNGTVLEIFSDIEAILSKLNQQDPHVSEVRYELAQCEEGNLSAIFQLAVALDRLWPALPGAGSESMPAGEYDMMPADVRASLDMMVSRKKLSIDALNKLGTYVERMPPHTKHRYNYARGYVGLERLQLPDIGSDSEGRR